MKLKNDMILWDNGNLTEFVKYISIMDSAKIDIFKILVNEIESVSLEFQEITIGSTQLELPNPALLQLNDPYIFVDVDLIITLTMKYDYDRSMLWLDVRVTREQDTESLLMCNISLTVYYDEENKITLAQDRMVVGPDTAFSRNVTIGGDVSIGGSLTIPSNQGVTINELQSGSILIESITGGKVNIGNLSSGDVYIDKLGYYWNPINITYHENLPYQVTKDSFKPHVFYRIKYWATGASNFNNAVIMFETRNSLSSGVNIGGTSGNADHILITAFIDSSGDLCTWDDCSFIRFMAMDRSANVKVVSEIMEVNLIPLHISFATMFDK